MRPTSSDADPPRAGPPELDPQLRIDASGGLAGGNAGGLERLRGGRPLALRDARVEPAVATRSGDWTVALARAFMRRSPVLVVVGAGRGGEAVVVVPDVVGELATVRFERSSPCDPASLAAFAAAIDLTEAESRVLRLLADGLSPREIGERSGTRESTVRSQVRSLLAKSGHTGIRPLLLQLVRLPALGNPR